jgi:hypothetical protein
MSTTVDRQSAKPARKAQAFSLQQLAIAAPCPAKWEEMDGDDRARFCHACQKHVYNIESMREVEIVALIERTEGNFCGRLARRADGTVLTGDCWVGVRKLRRALLTRLRQATVAVLAAIGAVLALLVGQARAGRYVDSATGAVQETIDGWIGKWEPMRYAGSMLLPYVPPEAN